MRRRRALFAQAQENLAAAAALASNVQALDDARKACRVKAAECRRLNEHLHEAVSAENWTEALAAAEALLEFCPEHEPARDAPRRACAAAGMRCGARSITCCGRAGNAAPSQFSSVAHRRAKR